MINLIIVSGNIGRDCEVKYLPSGKALAEFSLPVKSGWGDNEKTTWFKCVIFGKRAEGKLPEMLTKGQKVTVTGQFSVNEWTNKEGGTSYQCQIAVDGIDLSGNPAQQAPAKPQAVNQADDVDLDDDIPF